MVFNSLNKCINPSEQKPLNIFSIIFGTDT